MHPHLHTKDTIGCEEAIYALEACHHERSIFVRIFGGCNEAKSAVNKCLRQARLARTKANHEASREKNEKLRQAWREIDANS